MRGAGLDVLCVELHAVQHKQLQLRHAQVFRGQLRLHALLLLWSLATNVTTDAADEFATIQLRV